MAFRFGNIAFRKRMSWIDFTVACVVGVIAGIYTFKPGLQQAKEAIEKREALKEIQARRQAEVEKGSLKLIIIFHIFLLAFLFLEQLKTQLAK